MVELLKDIIRRFNNVLYYDSSYFRVLVLDPILMNDHSFLAFYKETVEFYNDPVEIENFKQLGPVQKNSIAFKVMVFAARRKSLADGKNQLEFFHNVFHEGMIQNKKLFNELIIPYLQDFKIITENAKYSVLLDYYTYKSDISDVPMYGDFAHAVYDKIQNLERANYEKTRYRIWGWCNLV
jgi:hypothetical protein